MMRVMNADRPSAPVDYLEAGEGPAVVLVHSSVSGARQWRRLIDDLKDSFHVRAVNLFGYGKTPAWSNDRPQTLDDQARLIEAAIPDGANDICLVGHSFGGSVAMKAAARLGKRVRKLVLLETNPFYLLRQEGRDAAFAEIKALHDLVKECVPRGDWETAAMRFGDYWGGTGSWDRTPPERRATFIQSLRPNYYEWDAVMNETISVAEWVRLLPSATLLISDANTVRPIREIEALLLAACPSWRCEHIAEGGHMAPLTAPHLTNPLIRSFLQEKVARA
jgi:pimeloyl-ACP methyl ester carboxylesterase